jgi:hypothetical protein
MKLLKIAEALARANYSQLNKEDHTDLQVWIDDLDGAYKELDEERIEEAFKHLDEEVNNDA